MFDAGAIQAHLDVDLSTFDRKLDAAEARVKDFERGTHEVHVSAVFDNSSLGRARQAFTQLDQSLSRDAMQRLRSSPQGSVLGAITALFSPHPVTGAPTPQQAASGGLLGRMTSVAATALPRAAERAAADATAGAAGGGGARMFGYLGGRLGPVGGGIISGIGPGVAGVSPLGATLVGAGGVLAAALPAATAGLAGVGIAGAGVAGLIATNAKLQAQAKTMLSGLEKTFTAAASPLIKPLEQAFGQIPRFVASIAPQLKQLFAASAPALTLFITGLEMFVRNLLPGLLSMLRAGQPAFQALASILGTLGKQLGEMFRDFAGAIGPSSIVLKALFDVIGSLLPVIGKLAAIFATALAPVVLQFSHVIESLMPTLLILGRVLAALAGAVLADLVSMLSAVAQVIVAMGPGLNVFATAFERVFTVMENNGVFASLGNALEQIATPLGRLISLILVQLTPLLPVLITLVTKLSTIFITVMAAGLTTIITGLTELLTHARWLIPVIGSLIAVWVAWDIASSINPIGAVVIAIVALVGAVSLLVTHWRQAWADIRNWAMDAWNFLTHGWGQWLVPGLTGIRLAVAFVRDNWHQAWADMQGWAQDFWTWLHQVFGVDIGNFFTQTVPGWFSSAVSSIGKFWGHVEDVIKAPVKFVIDDVLDGLISVFDTITNAVGLGKPISAVHPMGLAAGGRITRGTTPTADDVLVRVSRDETVVSAADSALLSPLFAMLGIPGYASGGKVGQNPPSRGGGIFGSIGHAISSVAHKALDLGKMGLAFATGNSAAFTNAFAGLLGLGNGGAAGELGSILTAMPKLIAKDLVAWIMGKASAATGSGSQIADYAMSWLGKVPYVWGGTAVPGGADCSGFVETIYKHFGINAPRTSEAQGSWVTRGGPQAGGLAFYHSPAGGPDPGHVAIIRSAQQVISQGGGMGPQLIGINALPLLWTGVPPGGFGKAGGGGNTPGSMSASAIAALWSSLGGPGWAAANMARIAFAESGDRPGAIQQGQPPGLTGWGLYQITPTSGISQNGAFGNLLNASNNTRAAISLFSASGYSPWASDPVGRALSSAPFGYAKGGLISEPVIGFGTVSGHGYSFGEKGAEWVTPAGSGKPGSPTLVIENISLPEGTSIARALNDVTYWLKVAQQQNYVGVLPGT